MENFIERFGSEGEAIKRRIIEAIEQSRGLTQSEIDEVWREAMEFAKTLPEKERGGFYWNSGLEMLFLLTSESKGGNNG